MGSAPRDDQLQELEAILSILGDQKIKYSDLNGLLKGTIHVDLEDLSTPSELIITDNGVRRCVSVAVLPPALLHFTLPPDYPSTSSPQLSLECLWMSAELIDKLLERMQTECSSLQDMPMLFFCCQVIVDSVKEWEQQLKTIHLDGLPYISQRELTGDQVVKLIKQHNEEEEDRRFESGCYDCEVCFDNKTGKDCVLISPCSHVFCFDCVSGYIQEKVRGSRMVRAITCLADGCDSTIAQRIIRKSIGEEEFDRYERIVLEGALHEMEDVVSCPRPSCQLSVILKEDNPRLGICDNCGYSFCVLCRKTYHGVQGCAKLKLPPKLLPTGEQTEGEELDYEYDRKKIVERWNSGTEKERIAMGKWYGGYNELQALVDTIQNEDWLESRSKMCPKCAAPIEKNDGCNKMICTKCKSPFCWLCLTLLGGDPYAHFREGGPCYKKLFEYEELDEEQREQRFVEQWEAENPEGAFAPALRVEEGEEEVEEVEDVLQGLFD